MSTTRKIVITYENTDNEQKTKTFSYANPNATDSELLNFAQDSFASLTTNTVIKTEKVDTTILQEE